MILPKVKIGSKAWHDLRLQGIGASEVSALFPIERPGYAMSAYTLRLVKRREIAADSVFSGDPEIAAKGLFLEPAIANILANKHGLKILKGKNGEFLHPGYVIDDKEPLMRCSVDYIIEEPNDWVWKQMGRKVQGPGIFQIKSVIIHQFRRHWTTTMAPDYVRLQVRQEMACLGYEWGLIGAGVSDIDYIAYPLLGAKGGAGNDIRDMIRRFWTKCVEGDLIPPIDESESSRLAIRALYPASSFQDDRAPKDREGDIDLDEAALAFDTAAVNKQRAEKDYDLARNRLAELLKTDQHVFTDHFYIDQSVSESRRAIRVKRRTSNAPPGGKNI